MNRPAVTTLQGPPAAPPARPTRPPRPQRKVNLHGEGFLSAVTYGGAVLIASVGGVEAAAPKFGLPLWGAAPLWLFLECVGVLLAVFAARRMREKNEKAIVARVLSAAIAGGVATLNFTAHVGNLWLAFLYSGASVAAYVIYLLQSGAKARDTAEDKGRRETRRFRYPLRERLLHPGRTRLAAEILARNPGMAPQTARLAAADHPVMLAFIRQRLSQPDPTADGKPGPRRPAAEVDGILHVLEPHTLVPMFREQMGPYRADLVKVMVAELGAKNLLGPATTRQKLPAPRVDATALTAGAGRAASPHRPAPARRTTDESAAMYLQLRAEHGLYDQATGTGWKQEQFAKAMGFDSTQRLRQIKKTARITDEK